MAKFLLTWELGGGTGHCINLRPIAEFLARKGHRVFVALRDVSIAHPIFSDLDVAILQAPYKTGRPRHPINIPRTFAHILHNTGFENLEDLRCLTDAWYNLFQAIGPDVIVFEHSPIAILASRRLPVRRVIVGTGFFSPPDVYPWPDLRPWMRPEPERLKQDEDTICQRVINLLEIWKTPPIERLGQLYSELDANYLLTFSELDHYSKRIHGNYWGNWSPPGGDVPDWPNGDGKRIFCYLRPFKGVEILLSLLAELNLNVLLNIPDNLNPRLKLRFDSKRIRFADRRLDMEKIRETCDLAILNANAGTAITLLLGGIPGFHIPLHLEQAVFAHRLSKLGLGLMGSIDQPGQIGGRLVSMMEQNRFSSAAAEFAARHSGFDPQEKMANLAKEIEDLAINA